MLRNRSAALLSMAVLALAVSAPAEETVKLKPLPSGAMRRMGGYMPQQLRLKAEKPEGLTKAPELAAPLFGVLSIGAKEAPVKVIVVVDEPEGRPSRLLVDSNANGDLTDDPAPKWAGIRQNGPDGKELTMYMGEAAVELPLGGKPAPAQLGMYRFDKNDPLRPALKDVLMYYADYGYEGEISLGDVKYNVMLVDRLATGDFRGDGGSGVMLMIDVNKNGRFDSRGENYDASKPFNIKGTTYEIAGMTASGAEFRIIPSDKTVAEVLPPPDLSPGKQALRFKAKTTDGEEVSFPSTYAGKLVLLDFWATWCGPCIAELPHLIKAYETFHDEGLEVLGISLDQPNAGEKLAGFTREKKMPWRQVYDGKFWQAEVADLYAVDSIPRAYLVDGDTGEILATGASLRGTQLEQTIANALAGKRLLKADQDAARPLAPPQPAPAIEPGTASPSITSAIGMTLVRIPAGEFLMGSPRSDDEAQKDEKPQHRVRLSRPFYINVPG